MKQILASLFVCLLISSSAYSDSIVITDTHGVTRAEQSLSKDESEGSVQFSVLDSQGNPGQGFDVLLKNSATGETLTAQADGGSVVFSAVPAGIWIVSTATSGVTFTSVIIAPALMAGTLGAAGLTTGVVAVGGVGAVAATAVAISENNNNGSDMSPSS